MPGYNFRSNPVKKPSYRFRSKSKPRSQPNKSVKKEVKKNTKDIKLLKSVGFQYAPFQQREVGTISNFLHTSLLTAPNNWGGIFRMHGVSNEDLPRQYMMKSVDVNWIAQAEASEVGNLWLQVFVVSLKHKMANQVLTRTTRLTNLEEGLDYTSQSAGTAFALQGDLGYKLNPDLYTIHYHSGQRRIGESTVGESPVAVTNINNGTTMGSCRIKWPHTFKNDETSDAGFKELTYQNIEPKQHLYLLVMSNTSGSVITGGELFFSSRAQFNGHVNNPN
ncbi:hypothetical protein [Circovirus-like genome SAR-A]|uniref:hypothetical protein n=1 Tax=Circovirus-like genome SAR-A TaxID=642258 RepID=UPI0001B07E81|nr:hypothetical protein [Circovirus-like genome SAR-A]ACQ78171.2 hypothetical protein [Circovirus-like genome SAR-A]